MSTDSNLFSPAAPFQLFGLGPQRRKFCLQHNQLRDALTHELLHQWPGAQTRFERGEYRATLILPDGASVRIVEDTVAVWLETAADRLRLTASPTPIHLPQFETHPRAPLLRALHAEILVNLLPVGPLPNLWVYSRPWYRDAAMMALCLAHTGNVALLEPWIAGLHQPFDRNNAGTAEPDNLGQALYLISLVSDHHHPLVPAVLKAVAGCRQNDYICGLSDGAERPVYQTKWLKFGLRALNLDDPYRIPAVTDAYSSLFWMDYRDQHQPGPRFSARAAELYPYLAWAEAHFYNDPPPPWPLNPTVATHPLTWEIAASEADYARIAPVRPDWRASRTGVPHTWHAAEMFLYFLDHPAR